MTLAHHDFYERNPQKVIKKGKAMSDELRKRAQQVLHQCRGSLGEAIYDNDIDAMLQFAAEQVAAETKRCAKVCYALGHNKTSTAYKRCGEAIERGEGN